MSKAAGVCVALALMLPLAVSATEVPRGGRADARVKRVVYDVHDVVRIVGHYGYSTHIQFGKDETIKSVALGDSLAWAVAPVDNHLFVKPREAHAMTNMTVLTDKRVYNFFLTAEDKAKPKSGGMYFQVAFAYPAEAARAAAAKAKAEAEKMRTAAMRELLDDTQHPPANWNYVGCGSRSVMPNRVWDDRTYTYMKFSNNRAMPAVFVVDGADGDEGEALVNTHVEGDVIVIHCTAPKFVLRRGQSVACVINRAYDPNGVSNETGTTSRNVKRVLKKEPVGDE